MIRILKGGLDESSPYISIKPLHLNQAPTNMRLPVLVLNGILQVGLMNQTPTRDEEKVACPLLLEMSNVETRSHLRTWGNVPNCDII